MNQRARIKLWIDFLKAGGAAVWTLLSLAPVFGGAPGTGEVSDSVVRDGIASPASGVSQELYSSHLTVADGLSDAAISGVVQDSQGFMWFGTSFGGLNRYDGYEFKVYQNEESDPRSLSQNNVTVLYKDRLGTLWAGTDGGGLNRYNRATDDFTRFRPVPGDETSLAHGTVHGICEDASGALWVGTDNGLCRLDRATGKFTTYRHDPNNPRSLSDNAIRSLFSDPDTGQVWVGTKSGGVCVLEKGADDFFCYRHDPGEPGSLSGNKGLAFFKDRAGVFWIGTDLGLNRFVPETKSFVRYQYDPEDSDSISGNYVWMVHEDRLGRFWVGTPDGVNLMDRARGIFTRLPSGPDEPGQFLGPRVSLICEDNTGAIWLTDTEQGVNRLPGEPRRFKVYRNNPKRTESLSRNFVLGVDVDRNDRVWIGTMGGLNYLDGGRPSMRRIHFPDNLAPMVHAVVADDSGGYWAGAFPQGLFRIRGDEVTRLPTNANDPTRPAAKEIWKFAPDPRGGFWIVYWMAGLDYFDGRTFTRHQPDPANPQRLPHGIVYGRATDGNGMIWLGGPGGLTRLDPSKAIFTTYQIDPDHPENDLNHSIVSVFADRQSPGEIWVGASSGLFQFDPVSGRFTRRYTKSDGLCSDGVQSIQRDDQGMLWLGTLDGLSRFDPERGTFRNYSVADGLPGKKFFNGAAGKTSDGRLFFGTTEGLVTFDPAAMPDNPHVPPVVLTGFELFNKPVSIGEEQSPLPKAVNVAKEITLAYSQSVFTFKFAALNYSAPEKNRYAYMMEGFDDDWRYTGADRRYATYTRLAPGQYTFRVKASNNDGVWNEQGASISVVITPPWWGTWWFYTLSGMALLASAFAAFSLRIRSIKMRNLRLEREVAQRTAELRKKSDELRESQAALMSNVEDLNEKSVALEAANRELEAFAYSVSHDLRAPLRHVDGFMEMLVKRTSGLLDEKSSQYMDNISGAAKRMGTLIDDLLSFSRMGRREMQASQVDMSSLVKEIIRDLAPDLANRDVKWEIAELPNISGDSSLLRVALVNLISNALKFTGPRELAIIEVGFEEQDDVTVFWVRDNGVGFDPEYAQKLFGVFQRLHRDDEFEGTGIGLANVSRVVERHGGRVWAEGQLDQGATFYFTIPSREQWTS